MSIADTAGVFPAAASVYETISLLHDLPLHVSAQAFFLPERYYVTVTGLLPFTFRQGNLERILSALFFFGLDYDH